MSQQPKTTYAVDIVFCVDCTGSMQPYLESVKRSATEFHRLLEEKMAVKNKGIRQLRVRIIAFRDIGEEGDESIVATNFFTLPAEGAAFNSFVSKLAAGGGGDEPESALEALALAIQSPWERTMDKRRHIVVVCTDASAHPLGKFRMPTRLVQRRPAGEHGRPERDVGRRGRRGAHGVRGEAPGCFSAWTSTRGPICPSCSRTASGSSPRPVRA